MTDHMVEDVRHNKEGDLHTQSVNSSTKVDQWKVKLSETDLAEITRICKRTIFQKQMEEEEEEEVEAEGRDMPQVPGIRDKVMSRHVGTSGPKSRQALLLGTFEPPSGDFWAPHYKH